MYPNPIDIHDTCQLCVQVPRITICVKSQKKNVERGQGRMSFYFWTNID